MARKQFETIVASAPRESLVVTTNAFGGLTIPVGGRVDFDLFAPVGSIGNLKNTYVLLEQIPSSMGATSGVQEVLFGTSALAGAYAYANIKFDKQLQYNRFQFNDAILITPNDVSGLVSAIKDIPFDSNTSFRLVYINSTNAVLTNVSFRWYVTWVKKELA